MDVSVKIGGVSAVVAVASHDEAAELLACLAADPVPSGTFVEGQDNRTDEDKVREAVRQLGDTAARKLLDVLATAGGWVRASEIRERLRLDYRANIGPLIANVTRVANPIGLGHVRLIQQRHLADRTVPAREFEYCLSPILRRALVKQ
jgi:hypothetical protein